MSKSRSTNATASPSERQSNREQAKKRLEWVLQFTNHDPVKAAIILNTTVRELNEMMGELGILERRVFQE